MKDLSDSATYLAEVILEQVVNPQSYAMKHGMTLEPHAKQKFKSIMS